jgi:shikimate kinase
VLVGPMGVGKTSVGRELAGILDRPFLDSDVEIERAQGRNSGDIAAELGVAHLHEVELRILFEMAGADTACVIAPASSVVDFKEARDLLKRCITIRLTASKQEISGRIGPGDHRRVITEREARLLDREREPYLRGLANVSIDTTDLSAVESAREIARRIDAGDLSGSSR